ncbi:MAG: ferredoxin--NADP reductase [Burkholderiaceae bacterium]|nr:ferredoxin--NADP reductase [Burkholderiaceae bacterium]
MSADQDQEKYTCQQVLDVKQWESPGLLSIKVTRNSGFNFIPGQFARIGLPSDQAQPRPDLWRAYSMVSHPDDDYLEFLSVTVPDGQFSPKLAALCPGSDLWVEKVPFGFLTLERFLPAKALWLVSTGTGLSAYLPMLRDAATWEKFEKVIIVHGVRTVLELAYREYLEKLAKNNPQFIYLPVTSREPWPANGGYRGHKGCRVTTAYTEGLLQSETGQPLNPEDARIMLCGNPEMVTEMRALLQEQGFAASRRGNPGTLAVENYW